MNSIASVPLHAGRSVARFYRYAVIDSLRIAKTGGLRELLRQRGWRFVAGVVAYYLVRDTFLYIMLPLAAARGML
jgi:hypothetical protein